MTSPCLVHSILCFIFVFGGEAYKHIISHFPQSSLRTLSSQVPPARIGNDPAWINLNVTILSMQPLDTLRMMLTIDLSIIMHWRDPRLDMESLNYADTLNVIHEENIWRPRILFQDLTGTEADTTMQWETFVAVLESMPDPDDITRVREGEVTISCCSDHPKL